MRRTALTALIFAALSITVIACTNSPESPANANASTTTASASGEVSPPPAPSPTKGPAWAKAGATFTVTADEFAFDITLTHVQTGVTSEVKASRGQYLTADVTVKVGRGVVSIDATYFRLIARDGTVYNPTTMLGVPTMRADGLGPNEKANGGIVFDVPRGAQREARIALRSLLGTGTDLCHWQL